MWNWRESRQDTRGTDDIVEMAVYLTGAVGSLAGWFIWPFKGVNRKLIGLIGPFKRV